MSNEENTAVHQQRVWLNQKIVDILKENPDGINKLNFWNIISQKTKTLGSCASYGVTNMNSLLAYFSNIEEVSIDNVKFIKLKQDASPDEMLSSKIHSLKRVILKVLQSNGGQVKRSVLWRLVAQEQGRAVVASDYGVCNIYEILTLMTDILSQVKINNDLYVKLVPSQNKNTGNHFFNDFPTLGESINQPQKIPTLHEVSDILIGILLEFPDGIEQNKIWRLYKDKTGKTPPKPEHYRILKESDFFTLPEFKNINQFTKNGKNWLIHKSWNDVNQESGSNVSGGTLMGTSSKMLGWGSPAGSIVQNHPKSGFLDNLWSSMNQMGTPPNMLPNSQTQKEVEDSLYLNKKPILPVSNVRSRNIIVNPINVPRGMMLSKEQLDSVAKECIEIISDAQDYVSNDKIEKLLLQRVGRNRLNEINLRDIEQLKSVFEHNRLSCKVNAYIQAFVKVRSLCTLRELEQSLSDYIINGEKFESLKLGPLHRLPIVFDMFKYPVDEDEFPDISSMDIMQKIRNFLTEKQKWTQKINMEEVMTYLIGAYEVPSPYHLGVRLRSLPLVVGVLKRAQSDAARNRRTIFENFKKELEEELRNGFANFRQSILCTKPDKKTIKDHYLKLNAETVVIEIFQRLDDLMSIEEPQGRTERREKQKRLQCFQTFANMLKEDTFAKMLFHVAICISNTELEKAAMELLAPSSPQPSPAAAVKNSKQSPAKEEILKNLRKYLLERINHGSLSLIHLDKIEGKLLEDFQFLTFSDMGYGHFIKFLLSDPFTKKLLEESGVSFGLSQGSGADSVYHISDVLSFVQQCVHSGAQQPHLIEGALCHQYAVKDVKKLGFGNIQRLMTNSERRTQSNNVLFEAALCAKQRSFGQSHSSVGILGHQTKEAALAILHNCPFLEDLSAWSHWSSVFEPQFGKLKDFVNKHGGEKNVLLEGGTKTVHIDILALEIEPGKYLKLVSQTSVELFMNASSAGDMLRTCGHLVSIIAHNKGLENAPLALMANHMKTTLFSLQGIEVSDSPYAGNPAKFVLDCLVKLPLQICISLANQIFLEPLGQVIGQTKSKMEILNCCSSISDSTRLEELGYLLGIGDWSDILIKMKSNFLKNQIETIAELESEDDLGENNDIEEEESSDDEEYSSESKDEEKEILDTKDEIITKEIISFSEEMVPEENVADDVKEEDEKGETENQQINENLTKENSEETEEVDAKIKEETNKYKELIKLICCEEFGIGVELNEDGQKLMRRQQERLGRSLDRLSKDLYSKDSHFVLELVQNADDNSYPEEFSQKDSKQHPSVRFSIDDSRVTVLNNECGFRDKDIRALCDVGKSTKGKHKFGYIGQKGIGFKSVFRVTDTPHIHSNGYHIYFDVNSGPMGYIQPHWIEDYQEIEEGWVTKIVLPLKDSLKKSKSLAASFNDIHPSLLLFLHRLKEIIIDNQVENLQTKMTRHDLENNVVEIHHDTSVNQWLILKKLLNASNISTQVKSGAEVESSEIALAFPLRSCNVTQSQVLPPKQPVFAFLPLRSYGFRFIIQGDFDLPSSREDVDKDSSWNQWLRNEIPNLFLESLEQFKTHPNFKSVIHAVAAYLQFVPGENEVLDFFRPVAVHILKKLRSKPCIPTQPLNKESSILWKLPSQTVTVPDALMREVATPEMLQKLLNLYYIHNDMVNLLNSSLAHSLGIEKLTSDHLLKIGEAIVTSWINITSVEAEHLLLISKWLACVYRSLDYLESNEEILAKISNIKIIPMSNGKLIALKEESVFLPLKNDRLSKKQNNKDPYLELWKDLNSIHPDLMCTEDAEINSQVHKLILQLGVKELFPSNIISHHILPILKEDQWKTKSQELLVNYVFYIKEQSEKNPQIVSFDEFIPVIQVMTNHGMKNPYETSIHFTPAYGNSADLQQDLPGYDWVLLDKCYIKGISQRSGILSWHEFFSKLGVTNFLAVKRESIFIDSKNYTECPWSPFYPTWPLSDGGNYKVKDYSFPEFEYLVKHNKNQNTYRQQMQKLCSLLDRDWDTYYCKYTMTNVYSGDSQHTLRETPTSFAINLQQLPWLPAKQIILTPVSGKVESTAKILFEKPSSIYLNSSKLESLLGHGVFYLDATLSNGSSFSSFLQIKSVVTADIIVELLVNWGNRSDEASKVPTEFCTSLFHIKSVYTYLSDELKNKELQDLFHAKPVIFVPNDTATCKSRHVNYVGEMYETHVNYIGKMYKREELWWEDSTGLFQMYHSKMAEYHMSCSIKKEIVQIYGDMKGFFETAVRISKFPKLYEYGELIQVLALSLPEEALTHVLTLFHLIGEKMYLVSYAKDPTMISIYEQEKKKLVNQISDEVIFPTKKGLWVSLSQDPIIVDDKELEKLFSNEPVNFLCLTPETKDKKTSSKKSQDPDKERNILEFFKLFNIAKLSESYTSDPITEHYMPFPELQAYMHKLMPILQRYLLANYPDIYNKWKELKLHDQLLNWKFAKIKKLEIIYSLKQMPDVRVVRKETCLIENNEFKVQVDAASSEHDIDRYIARYFSFENEDCCKHLKLFLNELKYIMNNGNQNNLEDKLLDQDICPLPPDEPAWFVSKPISVPVLTKTIVPEIPSSLLPTESNNKIQNSKEDSIRAWPPCASSFATLNTSSRSTDKPTSIWPAPQGPRYEDQMKTRSTKFIVAASESNENVTAKEHPSSDKHIQQDPVSYKRSSSLEKRENTEQGRRGSESRYTTGENTNLKTGVCSRSTSQASDEKTKTLNQDDTTCPVERRSRASDKNDPKFQQPSQDSENNVQNRSESPELKHRSASRKRSSEGGMEPEAKRHPEPSFGMPYWSQEAQDLEYEELAVANELKIPDSIIDPSSNDYNLSTGRWGENLVFNYLLQQKIRSDSYIFSIAWVNELKESGKPFDFEVKLYRTDGNNQSLYSVYIEVKSTLSEKKEIFEISGAEVQFAYEKLSNFHVYRVYNAGNAEKVRLVKIENLASQIEQKNVRLCLVI